MTIACALSRVRIERKESSRGNQHQATTMSKHDDAPIDQSTLDTGRKIVVVCVVLLLLATIAGIGLDFSANSKWIAMALIRLAIVAGLGLQAICGRYYASYLLGMYSALIGSYYLIIHLASRFSKLQVTSSYSLVFLFLFMSVAVALSVSPAVKAFGKQTDQPRADTSASIETVYPSDSPDLSPEDEA